MKMTPLRCLSMVLLVIVILQVLFYLASYSKSLRRLPVSKNSTTREIIQQSYQETEVDLRVIVLTYNRADSVLRCLSSLNNADYLGDRVHVDVWIDRSKKDNSINYATFKATTQFQFKHGTVKVHNHTRHVGIYGQWLGTWDVTSDTREIAFIVEDDITVSKYFYKWLKAAHKKYDHVANINGFSTQGVSMKHGGGSGWLHAPESEVVFSYPVLGAWGFSPSPKNWLSFIQWYKQASIDPAFKPLVPGILPTTWYLSFLKQGKSDSMWTMWHIYYAYKNKEVTIYVNFPNQQGLTINWQEKGLHYSGKKKTKQYPLLKQWEDRYDELPEVPVYLDARGKLASMPH